MAAKEQQTERERFRLAVFQHARDMGLEPIDIIYEDDEPAYVSVRNAQGNLDKRVLGGPNREFPGTGFRSGMMQKSVLFD